ncbi:PfkB family carbohydrate kinase [Streptomyces sp. MAR4 CNX-425]|uniref:PfkB family carbohydrate kinase n=1 Tax=Streptomyces sp. MAR4 CNX-425 TaxID=3406343 RepID=UPI003B511C0E
MLVPNRTELGALAGTPVPGSLDEVASAARKLARTGAVVVNLGAEGALVLDGPTLMHIPVFPVRPVGTTAAGDAFCAALAVALAEGRPLPDAARRACAAAALATTRSGAQPSLPRRDDADALFNRSA